MSKYDEFSIVIGPNGGATQGAVYLMRGTAEFMRSDARNRLQVGGRYGDE